MGEPGRAWRFSIDKSLFVTLAALPLLLPSSRNELKRSAVLLALGGTGATMLVSSLVMMSLVKPTGEMLKLVDRLQDLLTIPVARYLSSNLYVLSTIAFYALPALLAMGYGPPSVAQAGAVRRDAFPRGDHAGISGRSRSCPAGKHVDARRSGRQSWAGQRATAPI